MNFISMELIDPVKAIWKKRIRLNNGTISFRDGNSALVRWGATHNLDGTLLYTGKYIPVTEGVYDININLTELKYSLVKVKL